MSDVTSLAVASKPTSLNSASTSLWSIAPLWSASIRSKAALASVVSLAVRPTCRAPISPILSSSDARSVANISTNSSNSILPDLSASNAAVAVSSSGRSYLIPSLWRHAPRRRVSIDPVPPSNMAKTACSPGRDLGVTGGGADLGRLFWSSSGVHPRGLFGSCSSTLWSRPRERVTRPDILATEFGAI